MSCFFFSSHHSMLDGVRECRCVCACMICFFFQSCVSSSWIFRVTTHLLDRLLRARAREREQRMAALHFLFSSVLFPLLMMSILMHATQSVSSSSSSSSHIKALDMTPYISCAVCESLAKHLNTQLTRTRAELPSYKPRVPEERIQDILEVCI